MMNNLKWMWRYIKEQKFFYFFSLFLLILEILASIYSIRLQQYIIDDVLINRQYEKFMFFIFVLSICYLVFIILFLINPYIQSKIHGKIRSELTRETMTNFYQTSYESLQKGRTGSFVHYFTNEVPIVSRLIGEDLPDLIKYIVHFLFISILFIFFSPSIFLLVLTLSLGYVISGKIFSKNQKMISKEIQTKRSDLIVCLEEGVSSTREIIAFNRIEWEEKRFKKTFGHYYRKILKEGKLKVQQIITIEVITLATHLLVLGYGGYLVMKNSISIGILVVIYQFTTQLIELLGKINQQLVNYAGKMASVERIRDWMAINSPNIGDILLNDKISTLNFENVYFRYNKNEKFILNDFSLTVPIGKKIAIVGPSGSGKSTLVSLLTQYHDPEKGDIKVNGVSLKRVNKESWKGKVNIVFQEPYLFANSIYENLLMGYTKVSEDKLKAISKYMLLDDRIRKLSKGYNSEIGERGIGLSGGEKQRLVLIRALIREPEILILDESTSALDVQTEKTIQKTIDRIRRGKTTIIIAHRVSTIKNADMIYVFHRGQIVDKGKHEELLTRSAMYKKFVEYESNSI